MRAAVDSAGRVLLAAVVGTVVALGLEWWVVDVAVERIGRLATPIVVVVLGVGLLVQLGLRRVLRAEGSMSDDLVRLLAVGTPIRPRAIAERVGLTALTLGVGAPLGLEAPAASNGAALAATLATDRHDRRARLFAAAAAAAALAALLRAPLAGALFACEIPFRRGGDRRLALAAGVGGLVGAGGGWWRHGLGARFPAAVSGFDAATVVACTAIGGLSALVTFGFAQAIRRTGPWPDRVRALCVLAPVGAVIVVARVASLEVAISPGSAVLALARDPGVEVAVIAVVLVARLVGAWGAYAARGSGGLFVPLLLFGALVGRLVAEVGGEPTVLVFAGAAAVVAAGYRVPLMACALAFEVTGEPLMALGAALAVVVAIRASEHGVSSAQLPAVPATT